MCQDSRFVLVGSMPPPYHGSSLYFKNLATLIEEDGAMEPIVVDISDKRDDLNKIGAFDARNIFVPVRALFKFTFALKGHWPSLVFVPSAESTACYSR